MPRSQKSKCNTAKTIYTRYAVSEEPWLDEEQKYLPGIISKIPDSVLKDSGIIQKFQQRLRYLRENYLANKYLMETKMPQVDISENDGIMGGPYRASYTLKQISQAKKVPEARKLTQEQLANVLQISHVAMYKKENDMGIIDRNDLLCFSIIYQTTPHYLLGLVPEDKPFTYLVDATAYAEILNKLHKPGEPDKLDRPGKNATFDITSLLDFPVFEDGEGSKPITFPMKFGCSPVMQMSQAMVFWLSQNAELFGAIYSIMNLQFSKIRTLLKGFETYPSIKNCPVKSQFDFLLTPQNQQNMRRFYAALDDRTNWEIYRFQERLSILALRDYDLWEILSKVIFAVNSIEILLEIQIKLKNQNF